MIARLFTRLVSRRVRQLECDLEDQVQAALNFEIDAIAAAAEHLKARRLVDSAQREADTLRRTIAFQADRISELRTQLAGPERHLTPDPADLPGDITPTWPVHRSCSEAAGRVCAICRPRLGYEHPTPGHPLPLTGGTR